MVINGRPMGIGRCDNLQTGDVTGNGTRNSWVKGPGQCDGL